MTTPVTPVPIPTPPAPPFARTTCDCPDCVRCCTEQPGSLAAGELEQIAGYLNLTVREALSKFWASPGATVLNLATRQLSKIGTITPKLIRGRCVFLTPTAEGDRCAIHPVAPFGCRMFDTHMSAREAQPRSQWLGKSQRSPEYQSLRRTLPVATSHRPRGY